MAMKRFGTMILLYGAGGEPGRGEIPMDSTRNRASDDFLSCTLETGSNEVQRPKHRTNFCVLVGRKIKFKGKED